MLGHSSGELSRAILHTVAYADIFDYPLTAREIHHYLSGLNAPLDAVLRTLEEDRSFVRVGDYFTLPGREQILPVRMQREALSRKLMPRAMQYGRILGALPYVRMVALTGSLAVLNISGEPDFDYMLVTVARRLWTARLFAVTFGRMMRPFGPRICVNLLVSENALFWPRHDLYSAREICQMIPITGTTIYQQLRAINAWTESFLPNSTLSAPGSVELPAYDKLDRIQHLIEMPLRGEIGGRLEQWAMRSQLHIIRQRSYAGDETNFSADICQANIHHHRNSIYRELDKRLEQYVNASRVRRKVT